VTLNIIAIGDKIDELEEHNLKIVPDLVQIS
jgi:hypothetical protein